MINIADTRNKVKTIIGIDNNLKDSLIELIIEDTIEFFFNYTNIGEIYMNKYESLIRKIAVIRYNRLNAEGLLSESYSGASQNFIDGLPNEIIKELNCIRQVRF